jgi:hypothetical protein
VADGQSVVSAPDAPREVKNPVSRTTRWDQVKALFQQALDRAPAERSAFLRDACGSDEALREEVESQLVAHDHMGTFVEGSPLKAMHASAVASFARVLPRGERLGPYEIIGPLGAGGMGEVYKARDTRLDRTVALKVLPASVNADPQFRSRFDREARAIAALNHPHICTLHDIGHQDGVDFLVMECLDGQTLADRVAKGALPLDQALQIATEIADALAKAHRHGIVHRDLKPGNVMLTKTGTKLLDFGLAQVRNGSIEGESVTTAHTVARTTPGTLVGTLPYMAPEQVEGKPVDARTDIFAFGAVLYEMVTGRRAFTGESPASVIAAILERTPAALKASQPTAHPLLDDLIHRCLAKEPDARCQSAQDIAADLRWISAAGAGAPRGGSGGRRNSRWLWPGVAILALVSGGLVLVRSRPANRVHAPNAQFTIQPPETVALVPDEPPVVSPNGEQIVFVAAADQGPAQLWIRSLNSIAAKPLSGTDGAATPFWSPDSAWIGFFAGGKLKRVPAGGGIPQTITETGNTVPMGADWNAEGDIIFSRSEESSLYRVRVSAEKTSAQPLTTIDTAAQEQGHYWPHFLPDNRHFLFVIDNARPEGDGIYVGSLDSDEKRLVVHTLSNAAFVQPGYLVFARDRTLMAQPFDLSSFKLTNEPIAMADRVGLLSGGGTRSLFSVSRTGTVVYRDAEPEPLRQLTWFNRDGTTIGRFGPPGPWVDMTLSPDQRVVAAVRRDNQNGDDIWLFDVGRGGSRRLTSEPGWDIAPTWSPDSRYILFTSDRTGPMNLFRKRADGVGDTEVVFSNASSKFSLDWSPDGQFIIFQSSGDTKTKFDLWMLSLKDHVQVPLVQTPFDEYDATVSPDGRWLAYVGEESGQPEIYVQPFDGTPGRLQASTVGGGSQPTWVSGGTELTYVALDGTMMSVAVHAGGSALELETPKRLFRTSLERRKATMYCVTADGRRFLLPVIERPPVSDPMTIVLNAVGDFSR